MKRGTHPDSVTSKLRETFRVSVSLSAKWVEVEQDLFFLGINSFYIWLNANW